VVFSQEAKGVTQTLQYIASGLVGQDAFNGGYVTVALGVFFHFLIAFITAGVFYEASRMIPALFKRPLLWGPMFGVGVYVIMNYVVVPLTAAPKVPLTWGMLLNGILGHALLVGLPIAMLANRSARRQRFGY